LLGELVVALPEEAAHVLLELGGGLPLDLVGAHRAGRPGGLALPGPLEGLHERLQLLRRRRGSGGRRRRRSGSGGRRRGGSGGGRLRGRRGGGGRLGRGGHGGRRSSRLGRRGGRLGGLRERRGSRTGQRGSQGQRQDLGQFHGGSP